ncbi:MAG: hypothetical protein KF767_14280 [Bdellovibrionaceae bacterium]|nr:hypothetical protein [Pseudobdellovibrionaceae bacterium]
MIQGVQLLSATQAYQPGADVWILPFPEASALARNVDWLLNFQITRGLANEPRRRGEQLEGLLKKVKWSLPPAHDKAGSPLLIGAAGRLPTRWVLLPERWDADLQFLQPAADLGPAKVRLFLPANVSPDIFRASVASPFLQQMSRKFEIEVLAET